MFVRFQEHGFVRVSGTSIDTEAPLTLPRPKPIPSATPPLRNVSVCTEDGIEDVVIPADVSISNGWIPGPVGSLKWYESEALKPSIRRDAFMSERQRGREEPMRSMNFVVSSGLPSIFRDNEILGLIPSPEDSTHRPASNDRFIYETYELGKEPVHARVEKTRDENLYRKPFSFGADLDGNHSPLCLRCADRATFLQERRERDRARQLTIGKLSNDEMETIFASIGMGKQKVPSTDGNVDGDEAEEASQVIDLALEFDNSKHTPEHPGFTAAPHTLSVRTLDWLDIPGPASVPMTLSSASSASGSPPTFMYDHRENANCVIEASGLANSSGLQSEHPASHDCREGMLDDCWLRASRDQYRVEDCDDGIEDTIVTGEVSFRFSQLKSFLSLIVNHFPPPAR